MNLCYYGGLVPWHIICYSLLPPSNNLPCAVNMYDDVIIWVTFVGLHWNWVHHLKLLIKTMYGVWIQWHNVAQNCVISSIIYLVKINISFIIIFFRKCKFCRCEYETSEHYAIRNEGIFLFFFTKISSSNFKKRNVCFIFFDPEE